MAGNTIGDCHKWSDAGVVEAQPSSNTVERSSSSAGPASKGDQIAGNGSAELHDEGSLEIELFFDNGDDATLTGRRE
ncbi:MAG: hypothetical protein WB710_13290 [Stellaceae bacterium]